ncbi:MAG: hypothetical protein LBF26_03125, partial [Puniceicoccales bacterium]|nr:hypothetical protein [Puniceicoccales bacterium]
NPETIAKVTRLTREELFVFFDQSHCVGIDLPLPLAGKSIMTVCPRKTIISLVLQAILRARGFFDHQAVDIYLTEQLESGADQLGTPAGVCALFDRFDANEQNMLRTHLICNLDAELMEAGRRVMEEKANWFYRTFRLIIVRCGNWFILGWFRRHWKWLLAGCAELAITHSPFSATAWYSRLKEEAAATDLVARQRHLIGKRLRTYGADRAFFRETEQIVAVAWRQFGNARVFAVPPGGSSQVNTQTEVQVEMEVEIEQTQAEPQRYRGSARDEQEISCATTGPQTASQNFLLGIMNRFPYEDSQTFKEKIQKALQAGSTGQRLMCEILSPQIPALDGRRTSSRSQIPSDTYQDWYENAMLAQVPMDIFSNEMQRFAAKVEAIYENAKPREKEEKDNENKEGVKRQKRPPLDTLKLPPKSDMNYWLYVDSNFDASTRDKLIACFSEADRKITELCARTDEYKKTMQVGQQIVNKLGLADLFDPVSREVLGQSIAEKDLMDSFPKIVFSLYRILLQNGETLTDEQLGELVAGNSQKFKKQIGQKEKDALMECVSGPLKEWLAGYFQDPDTICTICKVVLNIILPPRPDNAAEMLARLALGAATGQIKKSNTASQDAMSVVIEGMTATVGMLLFGGEFDPSKPQNTEGALALAGILVPFYPYLDEHNPIRVAVTELFERTRGEIVKLGGRTLDRLQVFDEEKVIGALDGISSVNSWLQQYWSEFDQIFSENVSVSKPFSHAFTGDNDPVTTDARNVQHMLVYRDSFGIVRCLFITPKEAVDYGKLICGGNLVDAYIYDTQGNRIMDYTRPGEPEESPESDPDWGEALRAINEKALEFAFWAQVYNGTLTPEFLWRNPPLIPLYRKTIGGVNRSRECVEKFMEKSRQDPSWMFTALVTSGTAT